MAYGFGAVFGLAVRSRAPFRPPLRALSASRRVEVQFLRLWDFILSVWVLKRNKASAEVWCFGCSKKPKS